MDARAGKTKIIGPAWAVFKLGLGPGNLGSCACLLVLVFMSIWDVYRSVGSCT